MRSKSELIEITSDIVAAYVSNNHVSVVDLPGFIGKVHDALMGLASGQSIAIDDTPISGLTAAQIRKSVQRDRLISFIDGRSYKTLKRHLTAHGLTPATYRERFGLPADYPMVAAAYSEKRSSLAKAHGLGSAGEFDRLAS